MLGNLEGDGGTFERTRADGTTRVLRNELSSLPTHLKKNVEAMYEAVKDAVADPNSGFTAADKRKLRKVLSGRGGTLKLVIDVDRLPRRMSADKRDATLKLLQDAAAKLMSKVGQAKTQVQVVLRRASDTNADKDVSTF